MQFDQSTERHRLSILDLIYPKPDPPKPTRVLEELETLRILELPHDIVELKSTKPIRFTRSSDVLLGRLTSNGARVAVHRCRHRTINDDLIRVGLDSAFTPPSV